MLASHAINKLRSALGSVRSVVREARQLAAMRRGAPAFGSGLELVHARLLGATVRRGETIELEVRWRFVERLAADRVIAYYVGLPEHRIACYRDTRCLATGEPYASIAPGTTVDDRVTLTIPLSAAPGEYTIATFVHPAAGYELAAAAREEPAQGMLRLATLTVLPELGELHRYFAAVAEPTSKRFLDALVHEWSTSLHPDNPGREQWLANIDTWARFALSTNERGREVVREIKNHRVLAGARALDVGCGYGGFMVAFAEEGASPVGLDIDPSLVHLAEANLEDHGLVAPIHIKDITNDDDVEELAGRFDVITMNDVIEHVSSPTRAFASLRRILAPGGLAYVEIPNAEHPPFVVRDPHYGILGLSLLPPPEARALHAQNGFVEAYSVGEYLQLEAYERLAQEHGLDFEVLPEPWGEDRHAQMESALALLEQSLAAGLASTPEPSRALLRAALGTYLERARQLLRADEPRFRVAHGSAFWRVLLRAAPCQAPA